MRFLLAVWIAKFTYLGIKIFKSGTGYTLPGYLALKFYPNLLNDSKIKFKKKLIFISGTNGKTTTSKLLNEILQSTSNQSVVHNATGSNIERGIAATILLNTSFTGSFSFSYGVFEIDEFALSTILTKLSPDILLLLNLSRDQLDRYGEVDLIMDRWLTSVKQLPTKTHLVFYKGQKRFSIFHEVFAGEITLFDEHSYTIEAPNLKGLFNQRNVNAALTCIELMHLDMSQATLAVKGFSSAYGRGEVLNYRNTAFHIFLAKNPASFKHNLELLGSFDTSTTALLIILNDNIPDGRDVSWIYDIPGDPLYAAVKGFSLFFAGKRSFDMALRFMYANLTVAESYVYSETAQALKIITQTGYKDVVVFPNYSAMLEFRKLLTGRSIL